MIVKNAEIYRRVAEKHNLDLNIVESVGDTVFAELISKLNNPSDLAYELPKFGCWTIRAKEVRSTYINTPHQYKPWMVPILDMIDNFKKVKTAKREKRFEYVNTKNKTQQPSEDNL